MCRCDYGNCDKPVCRCRCHAPALKDCCRQAVEAERARATGRPNVQQGIADLKVLLNFSVDVVGGGDAFNFPEILKDKLAKIVYGSLLEAAAVGELVFKGDNFTVRATLNEVIPVSVERKEPVSK